MPNPTSKTHVATISLISNRKINNSISGNNTPTTLSSNLTEPLSLYNAISQRHTNRGPYDKNKTVTLDILQSLGSLSRTISPEGAMTIFWFTTVDQRRKMGDLIVQATQAIIADTQQAEDDFKWSRLSWQDIQTYKDGITLDAAGLPWYVDVLAKILPPISQQQTDNSWLQSTKDTHVATAAAFGVIAVHDIFNNIERLQGGMFYQRMHLWATSNGLAMQPMNQMTERADREMSLGIRQTFGDALRGLIADQTWQALMTFRIGYPTIGALSSPRRSVQEVVVSSV